MIDLSAPTTWAVIAVRTGGDRTILTWMANQGANSDGRGRTYKKMEFNKLAEDLEAKKDDLKVGHLLGEKNVTALVQSAEAIEFGVVTLSPGEDAPSLDHATDKDLGLYVEARMSDPSNYSIDVIESQEVDERCLQPLIESK